MGRPDFFAEAGRWLGANINLIVPLCLSIWMAWGDIKTRRIPNYLTLGTLLAGLGFQAGVQGWSGLASGLFGMVLGFALLVVFYIIGGMGAGDVKAMAALGAWLGPARTFELFIYMAIFGGVMSVFALWWRGQLWSSLRQGLSSLKNFIVGWVLLRPYGRQKKTADSRSDSLGGGIPYAVALAAGMAMLLINSILKGPNQTGGLLLPF
ncbi:MAG: prepilin peptidase [Deltaproteobacteria bacterium]|nr:prepilin peptidase [Deltaproteobacteria bacterium]